MQSSPKVQPIYNLVRTLAASLLPVHNVSLLMMRLTLLQNLHVNIARIRTWLGCWEEIMSIRKCCLSSLEMLIDQECSKSKLATGCLLVWLNSMFLSESDWTVTARSELQNICRVSVYQVYTISISKLRASSKWSNRIQAKLYFRVILG